MSGKVPLSEMAVSAESMAQIKSLQAPPKSKLPPLGTVTKGSHILPGSDGMLAG
jgi:hypothetical protein